MQLRDFSYSLPSELIAAYPASQRSGSRLLCLNKDNGDIQHRVFRQITDLLKPEDLLIFNDTRVIPARLFGYKETGGKVEALIERVTGERRLIAQLKASKAPQSGSKISFGDQAQATVLAKEGGFYQLEFSCVKPLTDVLESIGHMPLPPYIRRADEAVDQERYQTVYGKKKGAVAAPTAGLHFDTDLLQQLDQAGIDAGFVTLHVGAGTFQPVRAENILEHKMHSEYIDVPVEVCKKVLDCRRRGGRVIAVGTTSVRSLETAAMATMSALSQANAESAESAASAASSGSGESTETTDSREVIDDLLQSYQGETDIFIYPGYQFKVVDALITNFHLPESTLLMLVCALASRDMILNAYQVAVTEKYRFFSYGDAMFIHCG